VQPGLLLMGGGDRNFDAMHWFMKKAGNGHIVVLRASQGGEIGEEFFNEVGGIKSVETFVFKDREAATDPKILAALKRADGIFLAGGDQSRYVRYWRGTPVGAALDAHVKAGKPLGGTSAGLAMLGQYDLDALNDNIRTEEALKDPYQPKMTLDTGFITAPGLAHTITDSHFAERDRMGRLLAFMARLIVDGKEPANRLRAIGIDPATTLVVEGDQARVVGEGAVYFVKANGKPADCRPGQPLRFEGVSVVRLKNGDRFDLKTWKAGEGQPLSYRVSTADGRVWSDRADGGVY